jgi:hypothetical protein
MTNGIRVFDDISPFGDPYASPRETHFEFVNRAPGSNWARVRELVETWFSRFPAGSQADLAGRFRAKRAGQFLGAFWELYLYELFLRLGCVIARSPSAFNATKQPDFSLSKDSKECLLEATVLNEENKLQEEDARWSLIHERLDRIESPNYWLNVHIVKWGKFAPKLKAIESAVAKWINSSDPANTEPHIWDDNDWRIEFRVIPKGPKGLENPGARTVGMGPGRMRIVEDNANLLTALKEKADHYGKISVPFVIGAMSTRTTTHRSEVLQALYGATWDHNEPFQHGKLVPPWTKREHGGLWLTAGGPSRQDISALLYGHLIYPWSVARVEPVLYVNPWASRDYSIDWPFSTVRVDLHSGAYVTQSGSVPVWEFFGLQHDWSDF